MRKVDPPVATADASLYIAYNLFLGKKNYENSYSSQINFI